MTSHSDLFSAALVLDTSALINFLAVEDPAALLAALPSPTVVDEVASEVVRHPRTGVASAGILDGLFSGPLTRATLDEHDAERLVDLVTSPSPDDLDDGEAATIAYATRRGYTCVIDERKAHRILSHRFAGSMTSTTVGVYRELLTRRIFDRDFIATCVFDSLRYARMRVMAAEREWIFGLLSPDQIAACPSIRRHHRR